MAELGIDVSYRESSSRRLSDDESVESRMNQNQVRGNMQRHDLEFNGQELRSKDVQNEKSGETMSVE